jgi:glucoamylase
MLPEQVWDDGDIPEQELYAGKPAGSATPLVWAHAEYLKLLRSAKDGKVFDRVDPVYERYCTQEGRRGVRTGIEIYSLRRPVQRVNAGDTLRIVDGGRFEVIWSADGWKTTRTAQSHALGSAGFAVDLEAEPGAAKLSWTLHYPADKGLLPGTTGPETGRWLGYNIEVEIVAR